MNNPLDWSVYYVKTLRTPSYINPGPLKQAIKKTKKVSKFTMKEHQAEVSSSNGLEMRKIKRGTLIFSNRIKIQETVCKQNRGHLSMGVILAKFP